MTLEQRARKLRPLLVKSAQSLEDVDALQAIEFYDKWESYIGKTMPDQLKFVYNGELWRSRKEHQVLEIYPPSLDTASLYKRIEEGHKGTIDDPIPYAVPMEVFENLYYTEDGATYLCTRSSGTPLNHHCRDLIGHYFQTV